MVRGIALKKESKHNPQGRPGSFLSDTINGKKQSCLMGRTRRHQHKMTVAQSMGFPSCFAFSARAFICSFFLLSVLSIDRKLWAGGQSARYLLLCLKMHPAFPAELQHKMIVLVQVCQLL